MSFHYKFPMITHIDHVLPSIEGCDEIVVAERDDYTVVNYIVQTDTTFPDVEHGIGYHDASVRRECRGLIFDKEGWLISRPLQKFFNANERLETQVQNIDFSKPHWILEKLDGSMCRPLRINGKWRLATKMGITDVALQAEEFIKDKPQFAKFFDFCEKFNGFGVTPIFEWCSRKQRIVIDYPEDELVLLAVRYMDTGEYFVYEMLEKISHEFGIGIVRQFEGTAANMQSLIDQTREMVGVEGFVVRFEDGMMVKIKGDWYVQIHKAKEKIGKEKNLIAMILDNNLDDVRPFLLSEDQARLDDFEHKFWSGVYTTISDLTSEFGLIPKVTRKEFAEYVRESLPSQYSSLMFKMYDGVDCMEAVLSIIRKNLSTQKKVDSVRWIFDANWNYGVWDSPE